MLGSSSRRQATFLPARSSMYLRTPRRRHPHCENPPPPKFAHLGRLTRPPFPPEIPGKSRSPYRLQRSILQHFGCNIGTQLPSSFIAASLRLYFLRMVLSRLLFLTSYLPKGGCNALKLVADDVVILIPKARLYESLGGCSVNWHYCWQIGGSISNVKFVLLQ